MARQCAARSGQVKVRVSDVRQSAEAVNIGDAARAEVAGQAAALRTVTSGVDDEPLADHLEKQEVLRHNPKKPPQPPQGPGDETSPAAEGIIREIRDVYAEHNPDKLASVPGLLAKYAGQEQALLDSVRQKYGVAHGEL